MIVSYMIKEMLRGTIYLFDVVHTAVQELDKEYSKPNEENDERVGKD